MNQPLGKYQEEMLIALITPPKLGRRYETTSFIPNLEAGVLRMRQINLNSIDYSHQHFESRDVPFRRLQITTGSYVSENEKDFTCIPQE